jgi:hypothetical protein
MNVKVFRDIVDIIISPLEVPKMPKVEEFNPSKASGSNDHIYNKRWSATRRLRCASETIILGILDHFLF